MSFLLSFGFGAALSAFMPVAAFLLVVGLASAVSIALALARGSTLASLMLHVSGDAACAQIGYVAGIAALALIARARLRKRGAAPLRDAEDDRL